MRPFEFYKKKPRIFTGGTTLPDGRILETVRDEKDGLCRFLVFDPAEHKASLASHLCLKEVDYMPLYEPEDWLRAVRLPAGLSGGKDVPTLFSTASEFFSPLGEDQAILLAAFCLATWWADRSVTAPLLYVTGDHAHTVLHAISMLARRALVLSAEHCVGLFPAELAPTLLVSTPNPAFARRFLAATPRRGTPSWRGMKLVNAYCPRAVALADDDRPVATAINIVADVALDVRTLEASSEQLQRCLLGQRMSCWMQLPEQNAVGPDALLDALLYGITQSDLRAQISSSYERHRHQVDAETGMEEETAVIAALAHFSDEQKPSVYMQQLADFAAAELRKLGSVLTISSRRAGSLVRKLGFTTERLSMSGRGLRFTTAARARVEMLKTRMAATVREPVLDGQEG